MAEEFERLLCTGVEGMDLSEVDDGELDPVEQGSAARSSERGIAKAELPVEFVALRAGVLRYAGL